MLVKSRYVVICWAWTNAMIVYNTMTSQQWTTFIARLSFAQWSTLTCNGGNGSRSRELTSSSEKHELCLNLDEHRSMNCAANESLITNKLKHPVNLRPSVHKWIDKQWLRHVCLFIFFPVGWMGQEWGGCTSPLTKRGKKPFVTTRLCFWTGYH